MKEKIKRIAASLNIDEKIVAKIYKEWFIFWLDARQMDLKISDLRDELDSIIY